MTVADPFTLCTSNSTFTPFRKTQHLYSLLISTHNTKIPNETCADGYLNKNRMNVITTTLTNSFKLWETANCDDCYVDATSVMQNFSRNTQEFYQTYNMHENCINETRKQTNNNSQICANCEAKYDLLNKLFEAIKRARNNKICFDLEDKVRMIQNIKFLSYQR